MKLKVFFINCLNRRSFQFMSFWGLFWCLFLLLAILFCIFRNITTYNFFIFLIYFFSMIFPTFGLVSILSILSIYTKLLIHEFYNNDYRIKNKFLIKNPIYGFFAFIFYTFAIINLLLLLYLEGHILISGAGIHLTKEIITSPIFIYPFILYTLIHIIIVKKV